MKNFNCIRGSLLVLVLVLALIFAGVVGAQERWDFVTMSKEGSRFYIDLGSIIMLNPGRYLFWEKSYPVGMERQRYLEALKGIKNAEKVEYIKSRNEIDCPSMKYRFHHIIYYTEDGYVISSSTFTGEFLKWNDCVPDSVSWMLMERFCTKVYDGKEM